jgi:hypothetical protein
VGKYAKKNLACKERQLKDEHPTFNVQVSEDSDIQRPIEGWGPILKTGIQINEDSDVQRPMGLCVVGYPRYQRRWKERPCVDNAYKYFSKMGYHL